MESSDAAAPPGRALTGADVAPLLALSAEAGWNQTAADWDLMLSFGQGFGIDADGTLVASAMTLPYDGFAWISMVLVTPAWQRRGLAMRLMRTAVATVTAQGRVPVLDATPAGREVYRRLGFRDAWGFRRLVLVRAGFAAEPPSGVALRPISGSDWPALAAFDLPAFGADRAVVLRHLAGRLPAAAWLAERHGRTAGFVLGRDGRRAAQIGPLVAGDAAIAAALLAKAAQGLPPPIYLDVPDAQTGLRQQIEAFGAAVERPLTRMVHERDTAFGDAARVFAVAGPELG